MISAGLAVAEFYFQPALPSHGSSFVCSLGHARSRSSKACLAQRVCIMHAYALRSHVSFVYVRTLTFARSHLDVACGCRTHICGCHACLCPHAYVHMWVHTLAHTGLSAYARMHVELSHMSRTNVSCQAPRRTPHTDRSSVRRAPALASSSSPGCRLRCPVRPSHPLPAPASHSLPAPARETLPLPSETYVPQQNSVPTSSNDKQLVLFIAERREKRETSYVL